MVIALIAYQFGLIPIEIFSVLVAMAMITTFFSVCSFQRHKENPRIMDEKIPKI